MACFLMQTAVRFNPPYTGFDRLLVNIQPGTAGKHFLHDRLLLPPPEDIEN